MNNNKLALVVSYYLARFDKKALESLGFQTFNEAFNYTSSKLDVKANYVKLRRDEFDAVFPWRRGWQRKLDKQVTRTIEVFQHLEMEDISPVIKGILFDSDYLQSENAQEIRKVLSTEIKDVDQKSKVFILRGPTGLKAEKYFIEYHKVHQKPVSGNLIDMRDQGCGYDFEIDLLGTKTFVEVKGLADIEGGVAFTNKEWLFAKQARGTYFLVLIRNLDDNPEVIFIQDPTDVLTPTQYTYPTIQIQWNVPSKQFNDLKR